MKRVRCKDYFLTASVKCTIVPTTRKKYGTIVYPDGTNLRDDVILPLYGSDNKGEGVLLTHSGEELLTNDSQPIIFN